MLERGKKEKRRAVAQSVTDPDSGLFVKGEHERQFAYEAHTACDKYGFVLKTVITPGNVHDSVAFDAVYDEYYDCIICPEYQILKYATTNREGYRIYKSDPRICANCLSRELCTHRTS